MSTKNRETVISVIAPIFNDAALLADWTRRTSALLKENYNYYEIIFVDDASNDSTEKEINALLKTYPALRFIQLSQKCGFDVAAAAGLHQCIGDYAVITSLRQDPPEQIPEIIEKTQMGVGVCVGLAEKTPRHFFLRGILARLFHWYTSRYLNLDLIPGATHLKCLSRSHINSITRIRDRHRQMRLLIAMVSYKKDFFRYNPISSGRNRKNLTEDIETGLEMIVNFSLHPLRIVSRLSVLVALLNLVYLFYVVAVYFLKSDVSPGWTTLSLQHGVMFLFTFIILATISEYLGRALYETRERPLYFIMGEKSSAIQIENADRLNITGIS